MLRRGDRAGKVADGIPARARRARSGSPPGVLMLVENLAVPFDRRVWQEACALREAGYAVAVICPRGATGCDAPFEMRAGIEIHRYTPRWARGSLLSYGVEYLVALRRTARLTRTLDRRFRFDAVHICNPPDLLFLIALRLRRRGARIVYDQHDLVPELFVTRFRRRGSIYRLALLLERMTYRAADLVIAPNEAYRRIANERGGVGLERLAIVRSAPDLETFVPVEPDAALNRGKAHLLCYLGVMGPQDGVDYALRALSHLRDAFGRDDFHAVFVGDGDVRAEMMSLASALHLDDVVEFTGFRGDPDVARYLSSADVCLAPDPSGPLNDVSTMNKISEYMAIGRPIVLFDLPEGRNSAGEAAAYARPNDEHDFARLIDELLDAPERRLEMGEIGRRRVATELSWERSRSTLVAAYGALVGTPSPAPVAAPDRS